MSSETRGVPGAWKRRLGGVIRVAALLLVVSSMFFLVGVRSAGARMGEVLRSVGAQMMTGLQGAQHDSQPRELTVNGVTFHLLTAFVPRDMTSVLDELDASCRRRGNVEGTRELLDALRRSKRHAATHKSSLFDFVLRLEADTEATFGCLDTGGMLGLADVVERTHAFLESGDLSAIGELRYALARRTDDGTSLLLFWTEGTARILRMFSASGDSPGRDLPGIPRPPASRRLLSAQEHGHAYSVAVYTSASSLEDTAKFYRRRMSKTGWSVRPLEAKKRRKDTVLVARKNEQIVLITISRDRGRTTTNVQQLA